MKSNLNAKKSTPPGPTSLNRDIRVEGWTAPGFERVRDALQSNVDVREEFDADFAMYLEGELVVDLQVREFNGSGQIKTIDSVYPIFSVTKAMTLFVLMSLVEEGSIDVDWPMSYIWPEFGQAGKEVITIRQVASHQAGLPAFDEPTTVFDLTDWELCIDRLARQTPRWTPGSAHGYHAITVGYLLGEIIRRVTGETVGAKFSKQFALPLQLSAWIGLPVLEQFRVQPIQEFQSSETALGFEWSELNQAVMNFPPVNAETFNQKGIWTAEIPAANGIADARSLARLFATATRGPLLRFRDNTIQLMTDPQVDGPDLVLHDQPTRFGIGFLLPNSRAPMLSPSSFGHDGRGGALAFADRDTNIAYAYVTSIANLELGPDRRNTRLTTAIREVLLDYNFF